MPLDGYATTEHLEAVKVDLEKFMAHMQSRVDAIEGKLVLPAAPVVPAQKSSQEAAVEQPKEAEKP